MPLLRIPSASEILRTIKYLDAICHGHLETIATFLSEPQNIIVMLYKTLGTLFGLHSRQWKEFLEFAEFIGIPSYILTKLPKRKELENYIKYHKLDIIVCASIGLDKCKRYLRTDETEVLKQLPNGERIINFLKDICASLLKRLREFPKKPKRVMLLGKYEGFKIIGKRKKNSYIYNVYSLE